MKTYEGVSHYGYESPYCRTQQPPVKEVSRKNKYNLRKIKNLKRDKDTFQLNKTLDERLMEKAYDARAFSESQQRHNQEFASLLGHAEEYTSRSRERPGTADRDYVRLKSAKLSTEGKENKLQATRLATLLRMKQKEHLEIRNKWQDHKHYDANSYSIMTTALRKSDLNFQSRREAEHFDRLAAQEQEKIVILENEASALSKSLTKEMKKVADLEKHTAETNRRILEKTKYKKELDEVLKKQEAAMKNLNSKIETLIIEEQGCLKLIKGFIEETS